MKAEQASSALTGTVQLQEMKSKLSVVQEELRQIKLINGSVLGEINDLKSGRDDLLAQVRKLEV